MRCRLLVACDGLLDLDLLLDLLRERLLDLRLLRCLRRDDERELLW